jgi:hypothetical protein
MIRSVLQSFSTKIAQRDTSSTWGHSLEQALQIMNQLTHAKTALSIMENAVKDALESIVETLDALYTVIYKKEISAS